MQNNTKNNSKSLYHNIGNKQKKENNIDNDDNELDDFQIVDIEDSKNKKENTIKEKFEDIEIINYEKQNYIKKQKKENNKTITIHNNSHDDFQIVSFGTNDDEKHDNQVISFDLEFYKKKLKGFTYPQLLECIEQCHLTYKEFESYYNEEKNNIYNNKINEFEQKGWKVIPFGSSNEFSSGLIFYNKKLKCIHIAYRGTKTLLNVRTDLNPFWKSLKLETLKHLSIHGGFLDGFESSYDDLISKLKKINCLEDPQSRFVFMGHSMGAALACIARLYFMKQYKIKNAYTYLVACPKMIYKDNYNEVNEMIKSTTVSFAQIWDPIPYLGLLGATVPTNTIPLPLCKELSMFDQLPHTMKSYISVLIFFGYKIKDLDKLVNQKI